jgi:hypothetical protein
MVQHSLNNSNDPQLVTAYQHLSTLYSERRIADYEPRNLRAEAIGQVEMAVTLSREAVEAIEQRIEHYGRNPAEGTDTQQYVLQWARDAGHAHEIWSLGPS